MLTKQDKKEVEAIVERVVDRKFGVFVEHMDDQFQRVVEIIDAMNTSHTNDIEQNKQQLNNHEGRLRTIEVDMRLRRTSD